MQPARHATRRRQRSAKAEALQAKQTTIRKEFEAKFRALATGFSSFQAVPLVDRQKAARELLAELNKMKYRNWLWPSSLECEDAFVALGLAKAEGVNGRGRPYLRWL